MPLLISLKLIRSILADLRRVDEGANCAVREHSVSGIDRICLWSLRVGISLRLGSCWRNRRI